MARILYVAKIAVDKDTGLALPELRGQVGTIVARGNPSSVPEISEDKAGTILIPGSQITVNEYGFTSSFWVEDADLPVSWWDGTVEVPLESVEGIAIRLDDLEVLFAAQATAAQQAATAAQAAQTAAEQAASSGGGAGGVTDHGALSGRSDDDHLQYHTDARGDERYYRKSEVDTRLNNAATQTSADDRNRSNHTGKQSISTLETTGTASAETVLHGDGAWRELEGGGGSGTTTIEGISDATTVGKQVLGAANAAAARSAIGAGTSSLGLGGVAGAASTAMRSDAILINPASVPGTGTYLIARTA